MNAAVRQESHKFVAIDESSREVDFKKYIHEQRVLQAKKKRKETFDPELTTIVNSQRIKGNDEYDDDTCEDDDVFPSEEDLYNEEQVKWKC